ncbi:MAG: ABC transporter substrate-binding protein [Lysobacterales bacterium]
MAGLALAGCQPASPPPGDSAAGPDTAAATTIRPSADDGNTATSPAPRQPRLAVFDLGSLDIIQALGGHAAIVPDGSGPANLQAMTAAAEVRAGSLFEPDAAVLAEHQPDLIILGRRSAGQLQTLSAIAPTINLATRPDHFIQDVIANTRRLGELLQVPERAEALIDPLQQSLDQLHALSAGQTGLILFTVGGGASVQAPGARHGMFHEVSGLSPVISAIKAGSDERARPEPGSPEALALRQDNRERLTQALAREPDWLIVLDRTGATGDQATGMQVLAQIPELAGAQAWQAGRVIRVDAAAWYLATGGIQGLQHTLDDMIQALRQAQ